MSISVALPGAKRIVAANIFAGPANLIDPLGVTAPTDEALVGMPIVKQCALDGSMNTVYYDTFKATAGSDVSSGTNIVSLASGAQAQCIFIRVKCDTGVGL